MLVIYDLNPPESCHISDKNWVNNNLQATERSPRLEITDICPGAASPGTTRPAIWHPARRRAGPFQWLSLPESSRLAKTHPHQLPVDRDSTQLPERRP